MPVAQSVLNGNNSFVPEVLLGCKSTLKTRGNGPSIAKKGLHLVEVHQDLGFATVGVREINQGSFNLIAKCGDLYDIEEKFAEERSAQNAAEQGMADMTPMEMLLRLRKEKAAQANNEAPDANVEASPVSKPKRKLKAGRVLKKKKGDDKEGVEPLPNVAEPEESSMTRFLLPTGSALAK